MTSQKRKIKLIQPRIQLRLTLAFMGVSALAFGLQLLLFTNAIYGMAAWLPNDGLLLASQVNPTLGRVFLLSFGLMLPLVFAVGILTTFRVAGPLYRFEQFLRQIQRGERPGDFRLRQGDELQQLATLLNEVTAPLRAEADAEDTGQEAPSPIRLVKDGDVDARSA